MRTRRELSHVMDCPLCGQSRPKSGFKLSKFTVHNHEYYEPLCKYCRTGTWSGGRNKWIS